ncbi:DUF2259 domain-containing protein [Deinococcus marmoris]|uniref:DUF2259 domain-containing protein n=1 Tax=Deinococcus marmoris TaxID=249408 RepID=A0A1U7NS15_9DEIO|nr:DUF2259 domain-containing protein [Deinococcus marmoris]OLV15712.1 hypothetical protein BOO71_0014041 [Deinococcus marmoris]
MKLLSGLLTGLLLTCGGFARADESTAQFYGWSPDGRSVAFLESHVLSDSSGAIYTTLTIVDSGKNTVLNTYVAEFEPFDTQLNDAQIIQLTTRKVIKQALPVLTRLKISDGRGGTVVWKPALQNRSDDLDQKFQVQIREQLWRFELSHKDYAPNQKCPTNGSPYPARGLTLSVTSFPQPSTTVTTTLQADGARLPARRQCAQGYFAVEVRVQGDYLAVLLAITRPSGFEGGNLMNYMLVTGRRPTP